MTQMRIVELEPFSTRSLPFGVESTVIDSDDDGKGYKSSREKLNHCHRLHV